MVFKLFVRLVTVAGLGVMCDWCGMGVFKPKTPSTPDAPPPVVTESDINPDDEASAFQKRRNRGFHYDKTLLSNGGSAGGAEEKKTLLG